MKVRDIKLETRFDMALATAAGWRRDAQLYTGRRRETRLNHARRMEAVAERMVTRA